MLKLIGLSLILTASSAMGLGLARTVRRQQAQTLAFIDAVLRIRHELQYRLTPLPELFAALGEGTEPVTAASVLTELLGSLDALGVLVLPAVPELPQPARSAMPAGRRCGGRRDSASRPGCVRR